MEIGLTVGGRRRKTQPAPPHILFEALTTPNRDPARPWLQLLGDEQWPRITADPPHRVEWRSLWLRQPDAVVEFLLDSDGGSGGVIEWVLWLAEPLPDASRLGHLRKRLNHLINAELRYTFGQ